MIADLNEESNVVEQLASLLIKIQEMENARAMPTAQLVELEAKLLAVILFDSLAPIFPLRRAFPRVETVIFDGKGDIMLQMLQDIEVDGFNWPRFRRLALPRWPYYMHDSYVRKGLYDCISDRLVTGHPIEELELGDSDRLIREPDEWRHEKMRNGRSLADIVHISTYNEEDYA